MRGSRTHYRREEDRAKYPYVDRYSFRSIVTIVLVIILSITDAVSTLNLVSRGAQEINPVMDFFLSFGPFPFIVAKHILTGTCLIWFLIQKNYGILGGLIKVKHLLLAVLVLYVGLIVYELVLLTIS
ncbi:hypothetical protein GWO43_12830 [candidate division KSB1 bacterium]|nr:hypothetical protein [candidate division KSB1 bacterium]NIT71744.1 hypothetical protein [candidate division KSB1 bacterium]NIV94984.1 hypothetical protein [candidate division KSB1 bacterium]NIX71424.1 hypothetical protein [candidate division KSB1 bacterium]